MSGEEHVYGLDGIREGDNKTPRWLFILWILFWCWGIYYLFTYWTLPGDENKKEVINSTVTYTQAREEGFVASSKEVAEVAKPVSAGDAEKTKLIAEGKGTFDANCAGCHGIAGDGNGPAAAALTPKPRNFVEAKFKYPPNAKDSDLTVTIEKGITGTAMPPWKDTLSADQIKSVVAYLRTFHK